MSNHVKQRDVKRGGSRSWKAARNRASRPKSFISEEAAKKWADAKGLKSYTLRNLRSAASNRKKIVVC